jgi:hypothetical protein
MLGGGSADPLADLDLSGAALGFNGLMEFFAGNGGGEFAATAAGGVDRQPAMLVVGVPVFATPADVPWPVTGIAHNAHGLDLPNANGVRWLTSADPANLRDLAKKPWPRPVDVLIAQPKEMGGDWWAEWHAGRYDRTFRAAVSSTGFVEALPEHSRPPVSDPTWHKALTFFFHHYGATPTRPFAPGDPAAAWEDSRYGPDAITLHALRILPSAVSEGAALETAFAGYTTWFWGVLDARVREKLHLIGREFIRRKNSLVEFDYRFPGILSQIASKNKREEAARYLDPRARFEGMPSRQELTADLRNITRMLYSELDAQGADPARVTAWLSRAETIDLLDEFLGAFKRFNDRLDDIYSVVTGLVDVARLPAAATPFQRVRRAVWETLKWFVDSRRGKAATIFGLVMLHTLPVVVPWLSIVGMGVVIGHQFLKYAYAPTETGGHEWHSLGALTSTVPPLAAFLGLVYAGGNSIFAGTWWMQTALASMTGVALELRQHAAGLRPDEPKFFRMQKPTPAQQFDFEPLANGLKVQTGETFEGIRDKHFALLKLTHDDTFQAEVLRLGAEVGVTPQVLENVCAGEPSARCMSTADLRFAVNVSVSDIRSEDLPADFPRYDPAQLFAYWRSVVAKRRGLSAAALDDKLAFPAQPTAPGAELVTAAEAARLQPQPQTDAQLYEQLLAESRDPGFAARYGGAEVGRVLRFGNSFLSIWTSVFVARLPALMMTVMMSGGLKTMGFLLAAQGLLEVLVPASSR